MSYTWFKLHHDMPDDIKLRRFTPQEKWAWVALLCLASKSATRGVIAAEDDDIADYCEFNATQDWLYYRDKLIAKGMLEIGGDGHLHILHWEDRQYDKPSDRPEAVRERVAKHRANKKPALKKTNETPCNALQTQSNADVTPQTRSDKDSDRDLEVLNKLSIFPIDNESQTSSDAIAQSEEIEPIPEQSIPKRGTQAKGKKGSARRRRSVSAPSYHPDEFEQFWEQYRTFCFDIEVEPGSRKDAVRQWDGLFDDGVELGQLQKGAELYYEAKRYERKKKGEAIGVPHGCRFLANRKWQDALDWHNRKSQVQDFKPGEVSDWTKHPKFNELVAAYKSQSPTDFIRPNGKQDELRMQFLQWAFNNIEVSA